MLKEKTQACLIFISSKSLIKSHLLRQKAAAIFASTTVADS